MHRGRVALETETAQLLPVPPFPVEQELEPGCLRTHSPTLSRDPLCYTRSATEPSTRSRGVSRRRLMSSVRRVSHSSRRAKRRLCCKLQLWMWRKRRRANCHFWIFKAKKQEKGTCAISSSPCFSFKTKSQKYKCKVKKHHLQSEDKLQGSKSLLAAECESHGSHDRLDKENCLSKPVGLSEICTTANLLHSLAQRRGEGSSVRLDELPDPREQCCTAKPLQGQSTGSGVCVEITDKLPKKMMSSQRCGGLKLCEPVGPSERCAAVIPPQEQAAGRESCVSIAGEKMLSETVSSQSRQQTDVSQKALEKDIHEFLDDFFRIYGSFIPLQKSDVLKHLKRKFNIDLDKRKNLIFAEVTKYQAKIVVKPAPSFCVVYKKHTLTLDDLSTLANQNWLNDQVMNMYGELITESAHHKVHFLNSFFHRQLVTKGYEGVKRWTKKVDLFSKSLLLVPIHLEVHWCLVTADTVKKKICLYDSQGNVLQKVAKNILKYLMIEARERQQAAFENGWTLSFCEGIPQQTNENDCGVFVLEYCRCLALEKPLQFSQRDIPSIRKRIYKELCDCKLYE
ncbi:uncharacterized protein LOC115375138 [Myripristis murdjan]|uniref:uncharacterized protein LOC115375138 n=1 Tax=Myripristis murdjan TaxID=586833 RepID=UPI00117640AE|nr:sentrin-specific protease 5 [Myripristis murdjan]XP_029930341.1 sentrin-specific protease 5 [Myripristis murdjan]